jgi:TPR repeat protein
MYSDSFGLYKELANNGDAKAQFLVGWMYYKGKGVSKDKKGAIGWWKLSARKGNIQAINYLTSLGKW